MLRISDTKLFCHFCQKSNHVQKDCFGFKRCQQFREFEAYNDEQKEREQKAEKKEIFNRIKEEEQDDYLLSIAEESKGKIEFVLNIDSKREKSTVPAKVNPKSNMKLEIYLEIIKFKFDQVDIVTSIKQLSTLFEILNQSVQSISDTHKTAILSSYHQVISKE